MNIERRVRYDAPEGKFPAQVINIEVQRHKGPEACRPTFELLSLSTATTEFRAARSYRPQESDELIELLEVLTDGKPDSVIGKNGQIIEERLQDLIGKQCDLQIIHVPDHRDRHKGPFCKIVQVTPPGGLVSE